MKTTARWARLASAATLAIGAVGCSELEGDAGGDQELAILASNGLTSVNGLITSNGLITANGLRIANGLQTANGLSSTTGLMTTAAGRIQVSYLVKCALPAGRALQKQDQNGVTYTFPGLFGLGAGWETGACNMACQESVSACMMAHVNTGGGHVPLWVVSNAPGVGWGQDPDFPNLEGSYFGNVFTAGAHGTDPTTTPKMYCNGTGWNVSPWPGRIGSTTPPPFTNPFGPNAICPPIACTPADYPHAADGFKACNGWNNIVSVWRRPMNPTLATGTIDITTNTTSGPVKVSSPRQKTWGNGIGLRNMD